VVAKTTAAVVVIVEEDFSLRPLLVPVDERILLLPTILLPTVLMEGHFGVVVTKPSVQVMIAAMATTSVVAERDGDTMMLMYGYYLIEIEI
jgi:hypothetical protein